MPAILGSIFAYLGIGVVSTAGLYVLVQSLVTTAQSTWSGVDAHILAYLSLAGIPEGLSLVTGAYLTSVTVQGLKAIRFLS